MKISLNVATLCLLLSCFMTSLYGASVQRANTNAVAEGSTHTQTVSKSVKTQDKHKNRQQGHQLLVDKVPHMDSTQPSGDSSTTTSSNGVTESLPTEMSSTSTSVEETKTTTVMPVKKCKFNRKGGMKKDYNKEDSKYGSVNEEKKKTGKKMEHHNDDSNDDSHEHNDDGLKMDRNMKHHKDGFNDDFYERGNGDRKMKNQKDDFHGHDDDGRKMKHQKDDFYGHDDDGRKMKHQKDDSYKRYDKDMKMDRLQGHYKRYDDIIKYKVVEHQMKKKDHPMKKGCNKKSSDMCILLIKETTEAPKTTETVGTVEGSTEKVVSETSFDKPNDTQASEMSGGDVVGDVSTTTSSLNARGSGNTGETNMEKETTKEMSTDGKESTLTSTLATSEVIVDTTMSENNTLSTCKFEGDCYSDSDCNGGKCIGVLAGVCNCRACQNFDACTSDKQCGGLKGACDMKVNRCNCQAAYRSFGFESYVEVLAKFCFTQICNGTSDSCHGLPCVSGKCFC